jgi:hypothetical protein
VMVVVKVKGPQTVNSENGIEYCYIAEVDDQDMIYIKY